MFVTGHLAERATWGPRLAAQRSPDRREGWGDLASAALDRAGSWLKARGAALRRA
jgi:hypothetical protein